MIAIDSGVLLRYLTEDIPELAEAASRLIDGRTEIGISALVLLEATHVLRGPVYGLGNPQLADVLIDLLRHENVRLTGLDAELACAAIAGVRHLSARHIADALISAAARDAGAGLLVTNDRKFGTHLVPLRQLQDV